MEYKHSIQDINNHTGLQVSFIRRCLSGMKDIFKPHTSKGGKNKVLLTDSGLIMFDKIK